MACDYLSLLLPFNETVAEILKLGLMWTLWHMHSLIRVHLRSIAGRMACTASLVELH